MSFYKIETSCFTFCVTDGNNGLFIWESKTEEIDIRWRKIAVFVQHVCKLTEVFFKHLNLSCFKDSTDGPNKCAAPAPSQSATLEDNPSTPPLPPIPAEAPEIPLPPSIELSGNGEHYSNGCEGERSQHEEV